MDSEATDRADISTYQILLESTKAIPWRLDWRTKRFTYIGPQITQLLGWPQNSWKTVEDWACRIHPLERESVVNFCLKQSIDGLDHEADYRAIAQDGRTIWIRDVVHVVRKNGETESLVGFMLDISARKTSREARFMTTDKTSDPSIHIFSAFSFTTAERLLAEALLSGQRARDYAEKNRLSIATVRSQIRALLEKAGVRRQTDLILLLMTTIQNRSE